MRGRSIDRMGNGRGQKPMMHRMSILDENHEALERNNVRKAIGGSTTRERVVAVQGVSKEENIWAVFKDRNTPEDAREVARQKLRGKGYDV